MSEVSIQLPDEVAARLHALTERTGRSEAETIVEAVREYLDELDDLRIAEERLENIRSGRTQTIAMEDVTRRHGVAD